MIEWKEKYELPSQFAEYVGMNYAGETSPKHKKERGQFFTSKVIADFMADLASPKAKTISILDPGCGAAILSCSLIEKLVQSGEVNEIDLTLYETDQNVVKETQKVVLYLEDWLKSKAIKFTYSLCQDDFILTNEGAFTSHSLFDQQEGKKFDYIISNPPYFKISKADARAVAAKELVYGQPNIYALFMGLAAKLLNQDGQMIFITPRSFAAGKYFSAFRNSFFRDVSISHVHIFESRNKMFKGDKVLQENIIIRANAKKNESIIVSVSECDKDLTSSIETKYHVSDLIELESIDKILFIPSNVDEYKALLIFKEWTNTLSDFNIKISTGPVVAFRCNQFLTQENKKETVPLIWLHNIKEMQFCYPLKKGNKAAYISNNDDSRKVLLLNKNYVFLRRFSSKDDKSRLVCCPYFSSDFKVERIGVENHINYIHRPSGELSKEEILGISALYSSTLFDTYFRTFNGNTQVGASELKQIKMPPISKIEMIGKKVGKLGACKKVEIDSIIQEILLHKPDVKTQRSTVNS